MSSIYDTNVLIRVLPNLKRPQNFLLDTFFPNGENSDTEFVSVDIDDGKRRISPFVSPMREGKVVRSRGFRTDTFEPAYVKDKRKIDPKRALRRAMGEQIGGGQMSAQDREMANLEREMQDQIDMLARRKEVMAGEALATGKTVVTYEGEDGVIDQKEVDFGRATELTVNLTGPARWGETDVSPSKNLRDWVTRVLKQSGSVATDIVFTPLSFELFTDDPKIEQAIDARRGGDSQIDLGLRVATGGEFIGRWGTYNIWLYNDWYVDPLDEQEKAILPDGTVLVGGPQVEGVQAHGAIEDPKAGYQAMEYYPKSWIEEDPAVRWLMLQSAPLVIPTRINALLAAQVRGT